MVDLLFDRKLLRKNQERYKDSFSTYNFLYREIAQIIADEITSLSVDFNNMIEISAKDNFLTNSIIESPKVKQNLLSSLNKSDFSDIVFDEEDIPLKKESFDLVASNLNLQHINEVPKFLVQAQEILRKDGLFIMSFFGENNLLELKKAVFEAENKVFGGFSPRFIPVIDIKNAANLLQKAGFSDCVSILHTINVDYSKFTNILKDLKYMGQGNILKLRSRKFATSKFLDEILKNYSKIATNEDSTLNVKYEVVIAMGWKK